VTRTTWVTSLAICCCLLVSIIRLCLSETEWIHCLTEIWFHAACWCRSKHIFLHLTFTKRKTTKMSGCCLLSFAIRFVCCCLKWIFSFWSYL
jgi:hypothetical protein